MHASIRSLLDTAAEFALEQRLLALAGSASMLCDEAFGAWLATVPGADVHALDAAASDGGRSEAAPSRDVVVCTRSGESSWLARLQAAWPDARVVGLFRDVLPALVTERPTAGDGVASRRYLIVCPPRSGSYFLSGLLTNAGIGAPREHLRSSICALARAGCLDLLEFLADLEKSGTVDGTFGTKVISHYAFEAIDSGLPAEHLLAYLHEKSFRTIHLVRADRVERAVSFYFASATGVWATTRERCDPLPDYDFERIRECYRLLASQEEQLGRFIGLLPNVLEVRYEELDRNTAEVFARVLRHLGVTADVHVPAPATVRQRGEHSRACVARFRADLAARGAD